MANSAGVATAPTMQANMISGTYNDTAAVHGATPALFALTNNSAPIFNFSITSTNGGRIGTAYTQVGVPCAHCGEGYLWKHRCGLRRDSDGHQFRPALERRRNDAELCEWRPCVLSHHIRFGGVPIC